MAVLERITAETRRKTGALIPVVLLTAQTWWVPGPPLMMPRSDELRSAALIALGVTAGALWQWYSPRPIGDRLVYAPAMLALLPLVLLLVPGDWTFRPWTAEVLLAIAAGVVMIDVVQRRVVRRTAADNG